MSTHASEDKRARSRRPLYNTLTGRGYNVWYDEAVLRVGDTLARSLDKGLANSDHGVVVLGSAFFGKGWTEYELSGLVQRVVEVRNTSFSPYGMGSLANVERYSLSLANIMAVNSYRGVRTVADELVRSMKT